jgi:hypothetical protein
MKIGTGSAIVLSIYSVREVVSDTVVVVVSSAGGVRVEKRVVVKKSVVRGI